MVLNECVNSIKNKYFFKKRADYLGSILSWACSQHTDCYNTVNTLITIVEGGLTVGDCIITVLDWITI